MTPRFRDVPSPKSTVTLVSGGFGFDAGVTVNVTGTPVDPTVGPVIVITGVVRVTTIVADPVPRWPF